MVGQGEEIQSQPCCQLKRRRVEKKRRETLETKIYSRRGMFGNGYGEDIRLVAYFLQANLVGGLVWDTPGVQGLVSHPSFWSLRSQGRH